MDLIGPIAVVAGMPSLTLTDLARMRVDTFSFFLVGLLASAAAVRFLWNGLRQDFPSLPALSFRSALSAMILWGLLSLLILTMISGARELLTPGAWERQGMTYRLRRGSVEPASSPPPSVVTDADRRLAMEQLKGLLWAFAADHGGEFPASMESAGFPDAFWKQPGDRRTTYLYRAGQRTSQDAKPLVIEQQIYGEKQFVLMTDGAVQMLSPPEVAALLPSEVQREGEHEP